MVGASLGIATADGRWKMDFYARNLFDKRIPAYITEDPLDAFYGDSKKGGDYWQQFDANSFRLVGISVAYRR